MKQVHHPAKGDHWPDQQQLAAVEGGEVTETQITLKDAHSADQQQRDQCQIAEEPHGTAGDGSQSGDAQILAEVIVAQALHPLDFCILDHECLDHRSIGEVFLGVNRDSGEHLLCTHRLPMHLRSDHPDSDGEKAQWDQRIQGQLPVDLDHHRQSKDESEGGLNRVHHCRPEDHSHRFDITGESTHQITGVGLRIERSIETGDMLIELVAKLLLDATAGGDHRLPGPEGCQAADQDCAHHRQGNRTNQVDADPRLQLLNGQTHQTWHCYLGETRQ